MHALHGGTRACIGAGLLIGMLCFYFSTTLYVCLSVMVLCPRRSMYIHTYARSGLTPKQMWARRSQLRPAQNSGPPSASKTTKIQGKKRKTREKEKEWKPYPKANWMLKPYNMYVCTLQQQLWCLRMFPGRTAECSFSVVTRASHKQNVWYRYSIAVSYIILTCEKMLSSA